MTENQTNNHEDCQDCKREKKENEKFIAVYERMQNLRKNVQKTGCMIKEHKKQMSQICELSKSLDFGIKKAINCQSRADNKTISMIGYQMAASLTQKIAKSKIQKDNQYLRGRIQSLKKKKQEETHFNESQQTFLLPRISERPHKHNQTIINILPNLSEHQNKQIIQDNDTDLCSTKFSIFKDTKSKKLNASIYRQKYRNMNLWLYSQDNPFDKVSAQTLKSRITSRSKKA